MGKANPIYTNFSSGEWSARMEGRIELDKYHSSCRTLENMLVVSQGGADKRPGTKYIVKGKTAGLKIRLIPFSIRGVGEYILELGNLYIRVIKCSTHAQLETAPGVPLVTDVATPWPTADLFEIKVAQTKDAIYFVPGLLSAPPCETTSIFSSVRQLERYLSSSMRPSMRADHSPEEKFVYMGFALPILFL